MTLCCHPVIKIGEILGFGLHPNESRLGGIPGHLERGVSVVRDICIFRFFQEVRQRLDRWAKGIKAVEISQRKQEGDRY